MTYNPDSQDPIAEELAQYQDAYSQAPIPEGGGSTKIPDGEYQARIDNTRIMWSKAKPGKPPHLMLEWQLVIYVGPFKGARVSRWNHFNSAENLGWLKKDLAVCGLTLENLPTLERRLPELLDKVIEISIQTNGQYANVYFNRLLERMVRAGESSDEVPF